MNCSALMGMDNRVTSSEPREIGRRDKSSLSDEALLRLCAEGERGALEEIVKRYQGPLYRLLARLLNSPDDAEDAVLTVFVRAWQNAPRFQYRAGVATWLYRIAVNIARDAHRYRKARPEQPWPETREPAATSPTSPEQEALHRLEREDRARDLQKALNKLSAGDRTLLVLYYFEEMDYAELQAVMELSYPVLKTRLTRARQRLRQLLDADKPEAGL